MQVLQITLVLGCCAAWCSGQSFSFSFGTEVGPETVISQTPRRASAIPNEPRPNSSSSRSSTRSSSSSSNTSPKRPLVSSATNEIGKSPCPRGSNGFSCRQQLALDALTCGGGQCLRCRQGCDSLSPSEWPICCRDHFLCCRQVASACQQCDTPQLLPFCTAAFKRCF